MALKVVTTLIQFHHNVQNLAIPNLISLLHRHFKHVWRSIMDLWHLSLSLWRSLMKLKVGHTFSCFCYWHMFGKGASNIQVTWWQLWLIPFYDPWGRERGPPLQEWSGWLSPSPPQLLPGHSLQCNILQRKISCYSDKICQLALLLLQLWQIRVKRKFIFWWTIQADLSRIPDLLLMYVVQYV